MAPRFGEALAAWAPFYAALGGIAATLLGLLFVAVSLRLNLFRDPQVTDVRDFAALVFGQYLALVLLGLLALIPDPHPASLGAPAVLLGGLGLGWGLHVGREYLRLNQTPGSRSWWALAFYSGSLAAAAALLAAGGSLLLQRDADPLPWLAGGTVTVLAAASIGAWVLLSHAQSS